MWSTSNKRVDRSEKRVLHDLKEIKHHPLKNVAVAPLDEDVFEWHVNLRCDKGETAVSKKLCKGTFHLVVTFPEQYPNSPPEVELLTPVPHANVFRKPGTEKFFICLDMLRVNEQRAYEGWSTSYTARGLLVQLQAFLLDDKKQYSGLGDFRLTLDAAIGRANTFACDKCEHDMDNGVVYPALESVSGRPIIKRRIVRPAVIPPMPKAPRKTTNTLKKTHTATTSKSVSVAKPEEEKKEVDVETKPKEEQWVVVKHKRSKRMEEMLHATQRLHEKEQRQQEKRRKQEQLHDMKESKEKASEFQRMLASGELSKSQKRHLRRQRKRMEQREAGAKKITSAATTPTTVSSSTQEAGAAPTPTPVVTLEKLAEEEEKHEEAEEVVELFTTPATPTKLAILPYKVLMTHVFSFLEIRDVARMCLVSRQMKEFAEEGFLWRNFFSTHHPSSALTPSCAKDWKYVFQLEQEQVLQGLQCWHTKQPFDETILGVPIEFTTNPRTRKIDYIFSTFDTLSREAFEQDKVRRTVWNEEFTNFMPLYISREHFKRAWPLFARFCVQMSPEYRSTTFLPEMALNVLPKLMNTMIVLIVDKGISASEKAIDGYCAVHRLLLAVIERFPHLRREVDDRIGKFLKNEKQRTKEFCPNMGHFLPLLSVSDRFSWLQAAPALLTESFDRNVLWVCKEDPSLADVDPTKADEVDTRRLEKTFESTLVSRRLYMFHAYFLSPLFKRGRSTLEMAQWYDCTFGFPCSSVKKAFQGHVRRILDCGSWPNSFQLMWMKCPTQLALSQWLRRCVSNSLRKKYHSKHTDFSRIHSSGVSKILLKGESYSASPTLSHVLMEELWEYPDHVIFLDASCLAYDWNGKYLGVCDYSHFTSPTSTLCKGVYHSGDIIDYDKKSGKHLINVDLKKLGDEVKSLYFTMTAYTTMLDAIKSPYVRFTDTSTDMELCRYNFEKDAQSMRKYTGIIMCRMDRAQSTGKSSKFAPWTVTALGQLCQGRASDYKLMLKTLEKLEKANKSPTPAQE